MTSSTSAGVITQASPRPGFPWLTFGIIAAGALLGYWFMGADGDEDDGEDEYYEDEEDIEDELDDSEEDEPEEPPATVN